MNGPRNEFKKEFNENNIFINLYKTHLYIRFLFYACTALKQFFPRHILLRSTL